MDDYQVCDGCISLIKEGEEEPTVIDLCSFDARIVREEIYNDGEERIAVFSIKGTLCDGTPLPLVRVSADAFGAMGWVTSQWGAAAVIRAGFGCKDHLRAAIQQLSTDVVRRNVYSHVGWHREGDAWVYLHSGGAIGAGGALGGFEVDLGDSRLSSCCFSGGTQGQARAEAIRRALSILDLGPENLTVPLLAAAFRAPLGEAAPVDLSLFLAGSTGTFKSELTGIIQSFFGAEFNGKNLPGNWSSTANALERLCFMAKDMIVTIDDFAPTGSSADVARLHGRADRLLRGQGNRSGRGRMDASGKLRREYYPRGLVISSGEDVPGGESLRARMLVLSVEPGAISPNQLTEVQRLSEDGAFEAAMAGYLEWLAPRLDGLRSALKARKLELRAKADREQISAHRRTPDIIASLYAGWELFLDYACDSGAVTLDERDKLAEKGWAALCRSGAEQAALQKDENPVEQFLDLVHAVLISGEAYLADLNNGHTFGMPGIGQPQGKLIGWVGGGDVLLEPNTVFKVVQEMARAQQAPLAVSQRTLWKRLKEAGLLTYDEGQNTVKRTIGKKRPRVLCIPQALFDGPDQDTEADAQAKRRAPAQIAVPESPLDFLDSPL
ncbi:MAG TPA: hypothetical protein PLG65_02750 [Bacillota bacterium]|nr:hypothetical protein [Bacillota bacterium]